jgi:hypothetical protein
VRSFAALAAAVVLAGCGGNGTRSPEQVVRDWSDALNRSDDAAAAALFAPGAEIVQGGAATLLETRSQAFAWNAGLPCAGTIVRLSATGEVVTATFLLGHRAGHTCDGPGARDTAAFRVHGGKIVLWHELGAEPAPAEPVA